MMTYLKNTCMFTHAQLTHRDFEETQGLYNKEKELVDTFVPIGSEEDERRIKDLNTKAEEESKEEQLNTFLSIVPNEEEAIDYEVLDKRYQIVDWKSEFYHNDRYGEPHDYYRVFRADGSSRYIKTFTEKVSRFDRMDFLELHSLVMQRFETTTPKGIDLILWVHILMLEDGTKFHMLAKRKYPLTKETLEKMLVLRLIAESESEAAFDLLSNMDSSMGKMCLEKDVIEISSDQNEVKRMEFTRIQRYSREWRKKEPEALVSHKMYTEEDNDRYIAQCFVNGLYASDGEINLEKNDNLISNDYAVKLCLEYEVRKGKKLVKKELMVLLLVNFGEGTITIQPDFDPFLLSNDEEETDLPSLVCKLGKGSRNKKKILKNIMYFNGARPSSSIRTPLTQEEAEKRALAHSVSMRYEMLEEVRPMLKEKKDPVAFLFPIRLEDRINENALADTGSDTNTMPYKIYEQLGRDDIMKEERNITMINYTEAKVTGRLVNVLCQVGFTTLAAMFLILEIPVDRDAPIVVGRGFLDTIGGNIDIPNMIFTTFDGLTRQTFRAARSEKIRIAESNSDDEEDYVIERNEMGTPIHNSRPIGYQNNTNPAENITLSTLESVINPFRKINVWKKAVNFLGSLPAKLRDVEWKPDYKLFYSDPELATGQWKTEIRLTDPYGNIYMHAFTLGAYDLEVGSSCAKRSRNVKTVEEALLLDVHHELLEWRGCSREVKSRYNSSLKEAQTEEEVFFSVAWVRAFDIREPIYLELFREFYATYEFDELCTDNELQSKKIISFRLGGCAHSLTLLEFARRLGLYHVD
ncbi:ribonuclease H-like domain-containing protein [Tanacetum coccineum]